MLLDTVIHSFIAKPDSFGKLPNEKDHAERLNQAKLVIDAAFENPRFSKSKTTKQCMSLICQELNVSCGRQKYNSANNSDLEKNIKNSNYTLDSSTQILDKVSSLLDDDIANVKGLFTTNLYVIHALNELRNDVNLFSEETRVGTQRNVNKIIDLKRIY